MMRERPSHKGIKVTSGQTVSKAKAKTMREKPGGSNVGKYSRLSKGQFAGPAGGAPAGTYPINTRARAKAALSYARRAPNPEGIKEAVYKKYPSLRPSGKTKRTK